MQDECATANAAILKRLGGNTGQVQTRLRVHDVHELANEKSRRMRILMKLKLLKLKSNAMGLKIAKDKAARKKLFVATSRSLMRAKFGKGMFEELEEGMAEQTAEEAEFQRVYELFVAEHRDYFVMEHSSSSKRSSSSSEGSRVSPESRAALAKSCKDAFAYIFNKY